MKIESFFKEEKKLTKNELTQFPLEKFAEFDKAIKKIDAEELNTVMEAAKEAKKVNNDSIAANYIYGSIGMLRRPQEDNVTMQNLLLTFHDANNWKVVEFLSLKILAQIENKVALRNLAECYENTGREDLKWDVYLRLIKVDFEEKLIVKKIAENFEKSGDTDNAIFYYKRAINRNIKAKDEHVTSLLWKKLIDLCPEDFGYFIGLSEKVTTIMSPFYAYDLLSILLKAYADDYDKAITILKKQIEFDPATSREAKIALINYYKKKYEKSTRLADCLKRSGLLNDDPENVLKAIASFESDISFDKGSFVYQKSTDKLGVIKSIDSKSVVVSFGAKEHTMGADMAFKALLPLKKTHIRVLKSVVPAKLKARILSDTHWALTILLESNDNRCSFKEMKATLSPSILSAKEWEVFKKDAKKVLDEHPYFSAVPNATDTFTLRSTPITVEEKKLMLFRSEKDFYSKIRIIKEFVTSKECDTETDAFFDMIRYFNDVLNSREKNEEVSAEVIASFLILNELRNRYSISQAFLEGTKSFSELYKFIPSPVAIFEKMNNADLKKLFIDEIVDTDKAWAEKLKEFFPHYIFSYIPEKLKNNDQNKVFIEIIKNSVENFKEQIDVFFWIIKNATDKEMKKAGIDNEKLLYTKLLALEYISLCIESKKEVTENKARLSVLMKYLFTDKGLAEFINDGNEEQAKNIYALVSSNHYLDKGKNVEIRHLIKNKYPNFNFSDDVVVDLNKSVIPSGFLCTTASLTEKTKERDLIEKVKLIEVAAEIAEARSHGDLSENAEYQYSKDKQRNLNAQLGTLLEEIEKAQVITSNMVDPNKIGFGTEVELEDLVKNKNVTYKIFGQWESNPDKGILNFKAALGKQFMNKAVGDVLEFEINGNQFKYKVLKITVLDF